MALLLPVCGAAVLLGAALIPGRSWRRIGVAALVVVAGTFAIFAAYKVWQPDSYKVLTSGNIGSGYLEKATIYTTPAPSTPPPRAPDSGPSAPDSGPSAPGSGSRGSGGVQAAPQAKSSPVQVAGRTAQLKAVFHVIDDSPTTLALGKGLGYGTYAENIGVDRADGDPRVAYNTFTDLTTLMAERGALGIGVVGLVLALLGFGTLVALRRRTVDGRWTTATLVAYPGVLAVMAGAAAYASPLRNAGTASAFFLISAVALGILTGPRPANGQDA
jgi:hypothetical protein